jgi:hypothetical protein
VNPTGSRTWATTPGARPAPELGLHRGIAAAADETLTLPAAAPRVVGYIRFMLDRPSPAFDAVLRATAATRGYRLVEIIRSTDVSTVANHGSGINQIFSLIERRQVDGVLTLADYSIAWDHEVVRRVAARVHQLNAFLDFVWPVPSQPRRPTHVDRTTTK